MNARAQFSSAGAGGFIAGAPAKAKARVLPPDWDAAADGRLLATGGTYRKIAALSDKMRIAEQTLLTRWHVLRGRG